jgi:acetolactate synthase-1/3 small subunit
MRRIISILMENEPGALSRVVGLFSQRGYNIETLNVAATEDPDPVAADADDLRRRQAHRADHQASQPPGGRGQARGSHRGRPRRARPDADQGACRRDQREEIKRTTDIFRGQIVDVGPQGLHDPARRHDDKLDSFVAAIPEADILEVVRSGVAGIARGEKVLRPLVDVVGGGRSILWHAQEHSSAPAPSSGVAAFFRGCSSWPSCNRAGSCRRPPPDARGSRRSRGSVPGCRRWCRCPCRGRSRRSRCRP